MTWLNYSFDLTCGIYTKQTSISEFLDKKLHCILLIVSHEQMPFIFWLLSNLTKYVPSLMRISKNSIVWKIIIAIMIWISDLVLVHLCSCSSQIVNSLWQLSYIGLNLIKYWYQIKKEWSLSFPKSFHENQS